MNLWPDATQIKRAFAGDRQRFLDWINNNPGSPTRDLAAAFNLTPQMVNTYLRRMRDAGEIRSEERKVGRSAVPVHFALRTTSTGIPGPGKPRSASNRPEHIVHLCNDRSRPIPNQGGQGALRRQPTIACTLETV